MSARRGPAAFLLTALAVVLAGCAGDAKPETTPTTPAPPTAMPSSPAPSPEGTTEPATEPTCETIIPESTVAVFESEGWTAKAEAFRLGGIEIAEGIQCTWGDYSMATDHVQVFGWAPLEASMVDRGQAELLASGWRREEGDGGFYVTENAETALATDDEGYGFTYFFGEGFVTLADTKQGLILVEWPAR